MGLEEIVYRRLKDYAPLTELLCAYAGEPAVFYQAAPDDLQPGWGQGTQYPRLIFDIDLQADTERKSSGALQAAIFCDRAGTEPERIEPLVRECLRDIFIKPEGGSPYCFAWARTESFELDGSSVNGGLKHRGVVGQDIRFDILEYPSQETTDPDPVAALNQFLQELYPEACIIGLSKMGEITAAGRDKPVLYCRLRAMEEESVTNTVVWVNARASIHVVCPDGEARLKLAADIFNRMATRAEIIMLDRSPMRPSRMSMDNAADYLRTGQIGMTIHYGLLRWMPQPHTITEINISLNTQEEGHG